MKTLGYVCLLAGALCLLTQSLQPASPIAGTWEGQSHGLKAITLKISQDSRNISGTVVFYILKDEGSGLHVGRPSDPLPLLNPRWNGKVLRFSVNNDKWLVPFEIRLAGPRAAEGKRLMAHGEPELTVVLHRR